jgi:transcriptional regulator with AAA-type ATPase domain
VLADTAASPAAATAGEPGEIISLLDLVLGNETNGMPPLEALEQKVVEEAVARSRGNLAAAGRLLGMSRAQLAYRLQKRE